MSAQVLIVSSREEDLRLGEFLAFANDLPSLQVKTPEELRPLLEKNPNSLVFWDADPSDKTAAFVQALEKSIPFFRVFATTDQPLHECEHLSNAPVFGHHLVRRYGEPAPVLYARLAGAALRGTPFGLGRYFPEGASSKKIELKRSGHKRAAVEAIQNVFVQQNVNSRLSALVAQAVDELVMNAIFDAPTLPNGMPLRRGTDRGADFELIDREHVQIEIASSPDYIGISVVDQFGSLKKGVLMSFLARNYHSEKYVVRENDPGAGLGLNGIIQTGLSLIFACKPGVKTEVMIFFKKDSSYKDFRGGFRFLSVLAP